MRTKQNANGLSAAIGPTSPRIVHGWRRVGHELHVQANVHTGSIEPRLSHCRGVAEAASSGFLLRAESTTTLTAAVHTCRPQRVKPVIARRCGHASGGCILSQTAHVEPLNTLDSGICVRVTSYTAYQEQVVQARRPHHVYTYTHTHTHTHAHTHTHTHARNTSSPLAITRPHSLSRSRVLDLTVSCARVHSLYTYIHICIYM